MKNMENTYFVTNNKQNISPWKLLFLSKPEESIPHSDGLTVRANMYNQAPGLLATNIINKYNDINQKRILI